jgi:hypothetical protein
MVIKVLVWNAHSLRNKYTELSLLVDKLAIDLIIISESWLTCKDSFDLPHFKSYRVDRARGGSVIFIKSSIPHSGFEKVEFDYAEASTISIHLGNDSLKVSSIYCSPAASRLQSNSFFTKVLSKAGPHLVAGDFNCKNTAWNNLRNDRKGIDLFNLLSHLNFDIHAPDEPTLYPYNGEPSCVDFVVSKNFHFLDQIKVLNDLSSDHVPLLFSIHRDVSHIVSQLPFNFPKANWKKFRRQVDASCSCFGSSNILSRPDIDSAIDSLNSIINDALISSVPKKSPFGLRYQYSDAVSNLIKNRNRFRNLYKRTGDPSFKSSVNQLNRLIRQQIRSDKLKDFDDKMSSLSFADNSLFKFANVLKRKRHKIPALNSNNDNFYSDKDKSDLFARSFQNSFSLSVNASSKFENQVKSSIRSLANIRVDTIDEISHNEIKLVLGQLNPRKACGPDLIPNCALKALLRAENFISLLTCIFNACLNASYFPKAWKVAKIVPIPKTSTPSSDIDQYRPISMISCLGKCFEKLILFRLSDFETSKGIIIKQQCGFRSQHSTVHQILRITESASFGFNNNKSTGIVLLDLKKAFDSVWHNGLIHKLLKFKYPSYLVKLLYSYLSDRSAFVSVDSANSFLFSVLSGVPQGSIIAPHLFNIFLNDIPIPKKGQLCLFADDTAYIREASWKNLKLLKKDLIHQVSVLKSYFGDWKIFLNESKTEFSILTKSTKMIKLMNSDRITFGSNSFPWKSSVKYLGVVLDNKLTFRAHIEDSIRKASAVSFSSLYCLLNRRSSASSDSKIRIYKSYIRPIFTYAAPIFSNAAKCHLNKLQLFQNKLLRMILNVRWDDFISTADLHKMANVPLIHDFLNRVANNFYTKVSSHPNQLISSLGQYDRSSLGFRVKHKLPKSI